MLLLGLAIGRIDAQISVHHKGNLVYRYFINLLHTSMCQPVSLLSALCAMLFINLHAVSGMLCTSEIADSNNIVDYLMHDRCLGKMRLLIVLDYMMVQKSRCVANVSSCRMTKTETLFKVERDLSVEDTWCSSYCRLRCVDRHHLLNAWLRGRVSGNAGTGAIIVGGAMAE